MDQTTLSRHPRGGLYFEDFVVGELVEHRLTRTVTQMDNMLFSNMTLNPQPLHIDRPFCEQETEWGKPLMNSLFTLGLMIGISVNDLTVGTTIANLGMTEVKFPHPLFEGDTVHCTTEIIGKRESNSRPGAGIVELHHRAYNQDNKLVGECRRQAFMLVPGDSPAKLAKGLSSGADALIVDLEDSVSPGRKEEARATTLKFLREAASGETRPRLLVRVNGLDTGLTDGDLDAIVAGRPDAIVLPKAEGGASIVHLDAKLAVREARDGLPDGAIRIVAIATETAAALFAAGTYAGASARLDGLTWGAEDLSVELGAETNRDQEGRFTEPFRFARNLCLAAAAAAKVLAIDTVFVDFRDGEGLRREAEEARRDGFTAKMAIHPAQVATINEVFTPSASAIAKAQAIVAAFAASPDAGVVGIDGVMHDRPHLARAERLLARAGSAQGR